MSRVPSKKSLRPPDSHRLSAFDDMMYNQLRIDSDLFANNSSKRRNSSFIPTNSSPSRNSTIQSGIRRASMHVVSQLKPARQQQQPPRLEIPSIIEPTPEVPKDESESSNSAASGHLHTIHEDDQPERRPSSTTTVSNLDIDDVISSYYAAVPSPSNEESRLALETILGQLQDNAELETIIGGRPSPAMVEAIHCGSIEGVLLDACRNGYARLVEELLGAGMNVHCRRRSSDGRGDDGSAPIHLAAMYGQAQIATILLEHRACVNDHHHGDRRPLHEAAEAGYETMTQLLLDNGARPHLRDSRGRQALHLACQHGSMKVASLLLEAGASVDAADNNHYRPLHHVAQECDDPFLATTLLDNGCDINATTDQGHTALQLACISGNLNVLSVLLQRSASMKHHHKWSASPLNLAIKGAHLKITQLLLRNGADVNDRDPISHATASHLIIQESMTSRVFKKFLKLLLSHGMDINALDSQGNTSLHNTIAKITPGKRTDWQLVVAKSLLVNGADTGFANFDGDYPLDLAHWSTLRNPNYDLRLFRLLVAASIHHVPGKELARIENDVRSWDTPAERERAKEMAAVLGAARIKNDLVV
ncbi:MAG: hypothetical protein Q9174_002656 [Haloplaca sp. 1 TL-2023]